MVLRIYAQYRRLLARSEIYCFISLSTIFKIVLLKNKVVIFHNLILHNPTVKNTYSYLHNIRKEFR